MISSEFSRTVPLERLGWRDRIAVTPEFIGYPISAFAIIVGLTLAVTLMEGVGIALLYPIIELLQTGQNLEQLADRSPVFRVTLTAFAFLGLRPTLEVLMLATGALILFRQILTYIMSLSRAYFSQRAVARIASRTFGLFTFAGVAYTEKLRSGTLINALFTEAKRAAMFAAALQNIISSMFKIIVFVTLLLFISWQATLVGLGLLLVVAFFVSRSAVRGTKLSGQMINEANDRLTRYTTERFALFRLIKVQSMEAVETALFRREFDELRDLNVDVARYSARIQVLIEGAAIVGAFALIYLATEVFSLSLATLGVFLLVLFRLLPVTQELSVARQQLSAYLHAILYIDRISIEASAHAERDNGTLPFPKLRQGIRFEGVSFQYPLEARPDAASAPVALADVSIDIPACQTTALLGPSGAGKSTLADLIPRLREPTEGRILFDDTAAVDIRLDALRRAVALVSQDALIIDGTITENLRYGRPDATQQEIEAAAHAAFAHSFIEAMPQGYETIVGERGVLLSGGQKQRLALARALLAQASVLLLDEPTSALDAESETAVQRALATLQDDGNTTIIIIAHRLSTVRHADHIVVLENGCVIGTGTHDALMTDTSWYRKIVELQTGGSTDTDNIASLSRNVQTTSKENTT